MIGAWAPAQLEELGLVMDADSLDTIGVHKAEHAWHNPEEEREENGDGSYGSNSSDGDQDDAGGGVDRLRESGERARARAGGAAGRPGVAARDPRRRPHRGCPI